jgi:pyruvate/2-oxoglutarate/acetoin dehydrogenase E1 component
VWRLAALDTPVAYEPTLERAVLPQVEDIARDLRALLQY